MDKAGQEKLLQELARDVAILKEQVQALRGESAPLRETITKLALTEQRVNDLREGWQIWLQRAWMVVGPLLAAFITYYLFGIKK